LKPECSNIFLVLNEKVIDLNTRNMKGFEEQQGKVIEACEMTQMHVVKVVKETNEKWKTSREFQEQLQQLERNLCSSIARNKMLEKGRCDSAMQKKIELLSKQLEMGKLRENQLRQDLEEKRLETGSLQQQRDDALCKVADLLESMPIQDEHHFNSEKTRDL